MKLNSMEFFSAKRYKASKWNISQVGLEMNEAICLYLCYFIFIIKNKQKKV